MAAGTLLASFAAGAAAQQFDGPEIVVNTYTTGVQHRQKVAYRPDGSFIVVWSGPGQGDTDGGVFAQLFDAGGARAGGQFRVNTFTTTSQFQPAVATIGAAADFIVVWGSTSQDGGTSGTYAQRLSGAGAFLGPEFRVNTYTPGYQDIARVAGSLSGFAVTWESEDQDGDSAGIYARCYTEAGVPVGSEFRVNSYTTGYQYRSSVGMDAVGNFAVVWFDGPRGQTFGQRFASNCTPAGAEFLAHPGIYGVVGMDAAGNFVVAGENDDLDGNGISARRFSSAGVEQGTEFQVNTDTNDFQFFPEVGVAPTGEFVVTWNTYNLGTFQNEEISARAFGADGTPATPEFFVNTYTTGDQSYAVTSVGADGRFIVAWRSSSDGNSFGIAAQRFHAADTLFVDGFESGDVSAWSSSQADGGDLSVTGAAALKGTTAGLQALVDDNVGLFVQDDTPNDEDVYRARFYFDTNGFDPGEAQNRRRTRLFIAFEESPTRRLMAVVLRRLNGAYSVMGRARLDDNSQYDTGFTPIADGSHFVEVAWTRASGPDANDGQFELWIDGSPVHDVATLDNSISSVDFVRLGALSVKVGATGTLFWDEFVSRRLHPIGP